jgi:hypothetical protein
MFTRVRVGVAAAVVGAACAVASVSLDGQQARAIDFEPGEALVWRAVGPWRAGPITAMAGDASRLGVFYAASAGAGLWKTTDFGARWRPAFDAPPTGTVTAVAVAPSEPDVLYVAAGAGTAGAGGALHRSTDRLPSERAGHPRRD